MTEPILIMLALLMIGISIAYIIKQVSDYYVLKYHFSLWAGALLIFSAFMLFVLVVGAAESTTIYFLYIVGCGIILFTVVQDIRLSNIGMGLLAFLLQFLIAVSMISIILVVIARWIMNKVLAKKSGFTINPGIAIGLNTGEPFRYFFTLSLRD